MEITAKGYIAAKDKLAHLEAWIQVIQDKIGREDLAAETKHRERVEQLEKEYQLDREQRKKRRDMAMAPLLVEKQDAEGFIVEAKRILTYLSLQSEIEKAELTEPHPEFYHTKAEAEGDFHRDEYSWIRYYIVRNEKPKNCYSLLLIGNSKLSKLLNLHNYGLPAIEGYYPIEMKLHDMPSIKELLTYLEKHKVDALWSYLEARDSYNRAIRNYTLKDFEELKVIREATEAEAPIVFVMDDTVYRLYHGFYYSTISKVEDSEDMLKCLKVGGWLYIRGGRAEGYTIRQNGNLTFGDWWVIDIESSGTRIPFNKENWERELAEAEAYVKERWGNQTGSPNWDPPKITWVHPELIP